MLQRARPTARARASIGLATLLLTAAVGTGLPAAAPAQSLASAPNTSGQARLDLTIRYLQEHQNSDGGWGGRPGGASDPAFTAWVSLALAAAGINPQDQKKPGGSDAYAFIVAHAHQLRYTTDFDRVLLVAIAAGGPVHDFGGVDLVREILRRQLPNGGFPHEAGGTRAGINDTIFAILPLSVIDEPGVRDAIERAGDWVESVQDAETGGWSFDTKGEVSSDMTGSAIQALRALGRTAKDEPRAWDYIRTTHGPADGGFRYSAGQRVSNTASTAWVVQGMWAAGLEPANWSPGGPSPLDYLASMQDADGKIRWSLESDVNPIWMTAYAAPAFAGYPLPIPTVPRAAAPTPDLSSPPPTGDAPTDAPAAPNAADTGVIAGGGGDGAPNFSRPEPGSRGNANGGVRSTTKDERTTTKRRRKNTDPATPRPTASSNGAADAGVSRDRSPTQDIRTPGQVGQGDGGGGGGLPQIGGTVISAPRAGLDGTGAGDGAAPGLRSAAPANADALAGGLGALLLLGFITGVTTERIGGRQPQ